MAYCFFSKRSRRKFFGACAPGLVPGYAKPTFFLKEVQKNDLPQGLLGEIDRIDAFTVKLLSYGDLLQTILSALPYLIEMFPILFEKFFCDLLNIKGFFQLGQGDSKAVVFEEFEEPRLGGMAVFIFANQK